MTYTAYTLGNDGRPESTVHNGNGSPGTEVGSSSAGPTVETGLGVVESENIHNVHVISGSLKVTEKLTEALQNALKDNTESTVFTFNLAMNSTSKGSIVPAAAGSGYDYVFRYLTGETEGDGVVQPSTTFQITVPAGSSEASVEIGNLPRGTYTLTEVVAEGSDYHVSEMTVVDTTNCYNTSESSALSFVMGNNLSNSNVIGKDPADAVYTSYIDPVNGVFGEARVINDVEKVEAQIPVEKVWSDGADSHDGDAVYLVLYQDDQPVTVDVTTEENTITHHRILKLDATNGWKGTFSVPLVNNEDKISNYDYSVREVTLAEASGEDIYSAILENDGESIVWYTAPVEDGKLITINQQTYMVKYSTSPETTEDSGTAGDGTTETEVTYVVTNHVARTLPESGGTGIHLYTVSGLLMIAAALLYGYITQHRQRKGEIL